MKGWSIVYEGTQLGAELQRAILVAAGIDAQVLPGTAFGSEMFGGGRVLVPDHLVEPALELIAAAQGD